MLPVMAIYTFIKAFSSIEVVMVAHPEYAGAAQMEMSRTLIDKLFSLYSTYIPVIVFLWFIGITALLLKNLGGLIIIQRLKNYYVEPVSESIKNMVEQIRENYFIKKSIYPLISSRALSPMVIGHCKPVVLIPRMLAGNLSPDEMKIVLQHELAHIKRNDFLINIFQLAVESLFFFHPATWWISHIARQEREECCDALAAQTGDEKIILAKALTSIQEYKLKSNPMAVAFLNNKSGLYNRIKSIFGNRPSSPSFREGVIVMFFVFVSILFMSFVVSKNSDGSGKEAWKTIHSELPNGDYMFAKVDSAGAIRELFVNGEKVRKAKYAFYQAKADSLQAFGRYSSRTSESETSEGTDSKMGLEDLEGENPVFFLKTNEKDGKVDMSVTDKGFKMNVDDGKDQVDMDFGVNGAHMTVKENGKTTFQMNISTGKVEINVDSAEEKK
jgi:beta-lactamase regulating signal transducer with metallopeptidase domain